MSCQEWDPSFSLTSLSPDGKGSQGKAIIKTRKYSAPKSRGRGEIIVQSLGTERCFLLVYHSLGILRKILEAVSFNMHFSDAAIRKESIMSAQKESGKF